MISDGFILDVNDNSTLLESRLPYHNGIILERVRCMLEVSNVEEVGEVGIGIITNK